MNSRIVTGIVLSSLMVYAQAATPVQPQTAVAPVLQSSLAAPTLPMLSAAAAASAADVSTAPQSNQRVSTGVVAPKLIHQVPLVQNTISANGLAARDREATVSMIVDASGKPSDLKIVQSAGSDLDQSILQAVGQYRYKPGMLNGQVTAVPVSLHVVLQLARN